MGDFPTSGLRAVRNALYVLSMTYMPSVALYVVESTFKGSERTGGSLTV